MVVLVCCFSVIFRYLWVLRLYIYDCILKNSKLKIKRIIKEMLIYYGEYNLLRYFESFFCRFVNF